MPRTDDVEVGDEVDFSTFDFLFLDLVFPLGSRHTGFRLNLTDMHAGGGGLAV
jgi:hypothetical protein